MRLIDAEVLQKHLDDVMYDELCDPDHKKACFAISIYVDGMPTIAAEPVRHGEWVRSRSPSGTPLCECSICKSSAISQDDAWGYPIYYYETDFCPNCGAKMDGGEKN